MVTTQITTAAELFEMGSDAPFELIQGGLVRVSPSSANSSIVVSRLHGWLFVFLSTRDLGTLSVGEGGYLVETNPDSVVAPDVGFILKDRMPGPPPKRGYFTVRPDLVAEVISPTDERGDMRRKQALYDRIGVPLVWWIDPLRETAAVHAFEQPVQLLDRTGSLDGGDLLPGFKLALSVLFE